MKLRFYAWTINEPHLPYKTGLYRCYAKSPTVQDAFRPIPGLISCMYGFCSLVPRPSTVLGDWRPGNEATFFAVQYFSLIPRHPRNVNIYRISMPAQLQCSCSGAWERDQFVAYRTCSAQLAAHGSTGGETCMDILVTSADVKPRPWKLLPRPEGLQILNLIDPFPNLFRVLVLSC